MTAKKENIKEAQKKAILDEVKGIRDKRESGYREQALKLFPHICGRCGRTFTGKQLHQLTVHHIDHDHHNNPVDGSNWELLCIYCHDDHHMRKSESDLGKGTREVAGSDEPFGDSPFKGLSNLDSSE